MHCEAAWLVGRKPLKKQQRDRDWERKRESGESDRD